MIQYKKVFAIPNFRVRVLVFNVPGMARRIPAGITHQYQLSKQRMKESWNDELGRLLF